MATKLYCWAFIVICYVIHCAGWKAVPANQASFAMNLMDNDLRRRYVETEDFQLHKGTLHSTYRFGWCTPDTTRSVFMKKSINISIETYQESRSSYLYLLDHRHTQNFQMQCLILRAYVPADFMMMGSRIPIYYCQGQVFLMMLNTIQRIQIHEFYFRRALGMPISFTFEFYQAPVL